jgi:polyhydroxybutyrate depolymerase
MQIHGTIDGTVPYEGNFAFSSIDSLVSFWRTQNQCSLLAEFENVPDIVLSDNCATEHYTWNSTASNSSVEFYKVIGGDHSWPGAIVNLNTTNMDFSASKEIWRFFSRYRKNEIISSVSNSKEEELEFSVYPNPSNGNFSIADHSFETKQFKVYDVLGKLVLSGDLTNLVTDIYLQNQGIYYLVLSDKFNTSTTILLVNEQN